MPARSTGGHPEVIAEADAERLHKSPAKDAGKLKDFNAQSDSNHNDFAERRECTRQDHSNNLGDVTGMHIQDRYEITQDDCYEELGYNFPTWKKWYIVSIIFWVQVSMNFNTSLYSNALGGISEEFGVSAQAARCGAMIFLVAYAFGCELWAPWSEEFGRWSILQLSLFFVNVWQLPVALAPGFPSIMVGRALGGLSTAGGSVTLGMIADMWDADSQQYAVAYVVFSSVFGSIIGPIVGGFCEAYLEWRYVSQRGSIAARLLIS